MGRKGCGDLRPRQRPARQRLADQTELTLIVLTFRAAVEFGSYGSKAPFRACADDFRSTPKNRHSQCPSAGLKGANSSQTASNFEHSDRSDGGWSPFLFYDFCTGHIAVSY